MIIGNGMNPPFSKLEGVGRLGVAKTFNHKDGVRYEYINNRHRFGKECISLTWSRFERAGSFKGAGLQGTAS